MCSVFVTNITVWLIQILQALINCQVHGWNAANLHFTFHYENAQGLKIAKLHYVRNKAVIHQWVTSTLQVEFRMIVSILDNTQCNIA